jgi:hypothetical protein
MTWREHDIVGRLRSQLEVPLVIVDPDADPTVLDLESVRLSLAEREAELVEE